MRRSISHNSYRRGSYTKRRMAAGAFFTASVAVVALLLRFPPTLYSFYPRCPIHTYLHLECPGCGGTRAIASLLHGNFSEALHWNALVVALLPLLVAYAAVCCRRAWDKGDFHWPELPGWAVQSILAIVALFIIARNFSG